MLSEATLLGFAGAIDRRRFLRRVGASALGAIGGLIGLPGLAHAYYDVYCCHLCNPNSGTCTGCACTWCWACTFDTHDYACCECHSDTSNCGAGCGINTPCSYAYRTPYAPVGAAPAS